MNKSYTCTAVLLSTLTTMPCLAAPCGNECTSQQKQEGTLDGDSMASTLDGDSMASTLYGDTMASTIAAQNVVYINLASEAESVADMDVFAELKRGRIILIDATTINDSNQISQKTKALFGTGTTAPVTLVYHHQDEIVFQDLVQFDTTPVDNAPVDQDTLDAPEITPVNNDKLDIARLAFDTETVLQQITDRKSMPEYLTAPSSKSLMAPTTTRGLSGVGYAPILNQKRILSYSNLSCKLPNDWESGNATTAFHHLGMSGIANFLDLTFKPDLCEGSASVNLEYNITRMRSINGPNTDNAKYVRISLSDSNAGGAGAGVYLANSQNEVDTWKQSNTVRNTRLGPLLQRFEFTSRPLSNDSDITLSHHAPQNLNPNVSKSFTKDLGLGASVSANAEVDGTGPKVGAGASGSFSFSDSRTVTINHAEYRVENNTANKHAKIAWDHGDTCDYAYGDISFGCAYSRPLWYDGGIFNPNLFNSISHRNFVPSVDVLYRAVPDKRGSTQFRVESKVSIGAYYGQSRYGVLYAVVAPFGYRTITYTLPFEIDIDWDHPVFQPEANVRIQSLDADNLCLDVFHNVNKAGQAIVGYYCHGKRNQLWGLDGAERYRSRLNPDYCLTVNDHNQLTQDNCSNSLAQKWYWEGDKLKTRKSDIRGSVIQAGLLQQAVMVDDSPNAPRWNNYLSHF